MDRFKDTPLNVRQLTEQDIDAIFTLRLQALQESPEAFGGTYEETLKHGRDWIAQRFSQPVSETFYIGAFVEEQLVGMVRFHRDTGIKDRHKGHVTSMHVLASQRGLGIGKALLRRLIEQVRQLPEVEQLLLNVVTTNASAYSLYRALGFQVYGTAVKGLKYQGQYSDEYYMVLYL